MVYNYELYELDESELIWLLSSVLGMYSNLWQGLENTMEIPWVPWMSGTSTKACPQHHFAEYTAWVLDVLGSRCSRWLRCTPSMMTGMFGTFGMKMTRKHAGLIWRFWSIQRTVSFCCSAAEGQGSIQRDCHPNGQNTIASSLDSWWCLIWAENYTRIPQIRWFTIIFTLEKTIWDSFGMNSFLGPHLEDVSCEISFLMKLHRASFLNGWIKTWYYCKQIYKRSNPKRDISKGPVEAEWLGTFALRSSLSGAGHGKPCRIFCGF